MAKKKKKTRKKTTSNSLWKDIQSALKRSFTRETGIPTTKAGVKRKLGTMIVDWVLSLFIGKGKKKSKDEISDDIEIIK